jgi:glycerol-3-phosphate dehydrogenase subunit B
VPPSLPGWRLDLALLRALERAGIALVPGRVVARRASGTRLEAVTVERGSGERAELAADRFVLATGRFVGGGIIASAAAERVDVARGQAMREAELLERALGCDVWVEHLGDRFAQVQPVALTDPVRREPQALLRAGVHLDELGRPVDVQDRLLFENLVARGVVIAETSHGLGYAAGGVAA